MKLSPITLATVAAALAAVTSAQVASWSKLVSSYGTNAVVRHVSEDTDSVIIADALNGVGGQLVVLGYDCFTNPCTEYSGLALPGTFESVGVLAGSAKIIVVGAHRPSPTPPPQDALFLYDCTDYACFSANYSAYAPAVNVTQDAVVAVGGHSQLVVVSRYNGTDVLTEVWACGTPTPPDNACALYDVLTLPDSDAAGTNLVASSALVIGDLILLGSTAADRGRGRINAYDCSTQPCTPGAQIVPATRFPGSNWAASMAYTSGGLLAVGAPNQLADVGGYRGAVYILICTDDPAFSCSPYPLSNEPMVFFGPAAADRDPLRLPNFAAKVRFFTDVVDSNNGKIAVGAPNLNQNQGYGTTIWCNYAAAMCIQGNPVTLPDDIDSDTFDGDGFGSDGFIANGFTIANSFDVASWVGRLVF